MMTLWTHFDSCDMSCLFRGKNTFMEMLAIGTVKMSPQNKGFSLMPRHLIVISVAGMLVV